MLDTKIYKNRYLKLIAVSLIIIILAACNSSNEIFSPIKNFFRSDESRVLHSYKQYINDISSADFQLSTFSSDADFSAKNTYAQKIQNDSNVQYFPATLWQVYELNRDSEWKEIAENYSGILSEGDITGNLGNDEILQGVFMNSFIITGNPQYKETLIKLLSHNIAREEKNGDLGCNSMNNSDACFEKLLKNKLLFFATKETGDQVFKHLAINNSEYIFNHHFLNNQSNEVYYGLANWDMIPELGELDALSTQDFYRLALCFYGFVELDNEIGINRYHILSEKLAHIFTAILKESDKELDSKFTIDSKELIAEKVDLMSRAIVCLALSNLKGSNEQQHKEMAETLFDAILTDLEHADGSGKKEYSFRMYYYLFEYLKFV